MYILLQAILNHLSGAVFIGVDQICDTVLPILVLFSALFCALIQQKAGSIECIFPSQFQSQWYQVIEQYCWYSGQKHMHHPLSPSTSSIYRQSSKHFHVYVIGILLIETLLLFSVPRLIFGLMKSFPSPWNIKFFQQVGKNFIESGKEEDRHFLIARAASEIVETSTFMVKKFSPSEAFRILLCKLVKFSLIVGLFTMNNFILSFGTDYKFGLAGIFQSLHNQEHGDANETLFPVNIFCIFKKYTLGQTQDFTGQCYLAVNKWFLIVFFFHTALFFSSSLILFINLVVTIIGYSRRSTVSRVLRWLKSKKIDIDDCGGERTVSEFIDSIGIDFIVIVDILENDSGERLVSDVTAMVWKKYQVILRERLCAKMIKSI